MGRSECELEYCEFANIFENLVGLHSGARKRQRTRRGEPGCCLNRAVTAVACAFAIFKVELEYAKFAEMFENICVARSLGPKTLTDAAMGSLKFGLN